MVIDPNTKELLQFIDNECKTKNGHAYRFDFKDNEYEKNQEYKFHLEQLDSLRYVDIKKISYATGEEWIVEVRPQGHMYLKNNP